MVKAVANSETCEKRVLFLTLKKKWFDLIASGKKNIEYRECKKYWDIRLQKRSGMGFKEFDEIHFKNGYSENSPVMRIEFKGVERINLSANHKPENNEIITTDVYAIELGKCLEIRIPL